MFTGHIDTTNTVEMNVPGAKNTFKRVLIGPKEGWEGYVMRHMTLKNGGCSPRHAHPWPHINYVVSGKGVLFMDGKEYPMTAGGTSYVPAGIEHQYSSTSETEDFVFLCIVPEQGEY